MDIFIATNNPGKFREISCVLSEPHEISECVIWKSLADRTPPIEEPVEDGDTFLANAVLKARHYSTRSGVWALADDSGLEVDALAGAPGVHSAYYDRASAHLPREVRDRANCAKLVEALRDVPADQRTARYRCVLVLADADRVLATTEGALEGMIRLEPRGHGGFGYDPYFFLPELGVTVAEMEATEKNRISHRGRALVPMREKIRKILRAPHQPDLDRR